MVKVAKSRWLVRTTRIRCCFWCQNSMRCRKRSRWPERQLAEEDDFGPLDGAGLWEGSPLKDAVVGVVLHGSDEEDVVPIEHIEQGVVVVVTGRRPRSCRARNLGCGRCSFRSRGLRSRRQSGAAALNDQAANAACWRPWCAGTRLSRRPRRTVRPGWRRGRAACF